MKQVLTLLTTVLTTTVSGQWQRKPDPYAFLPAGYVILIQINGYLDKDGIEDCVLTIKRN